MIVFAVLRGGSPPPALLPGATHPPAGDPLAWTPERSADDAERATAGVAHVLYAKSPGGIVASAERTASWRPLVDAAARGSGEDPETLEAIVLLESAGRAEVRASESLESAVGLTQILAETGRDLLGMRVDVPASARLTRRIARAERRGRTRRARRLRAARRRVDERYDPRKALAATARYLAVARARLGRDDLAVASYHMGIGNLREALSLYGAPRGIPYVQLYFDSTPLRHEAAQQFLARLGDDSSTYLFRVQAAREVMRLLRDDRDELERRQRLQTARNSAEVLLHPPEETEAFADPDALASAYDDGDLVALPGAYLRAHGVAIDRGMDALASTVGAEPARYRGLRREALATLAYIGTQVRRISGARAPLRVTSTVRDER
ncbi:MAG TPA: transglycosylase SLT domain-containing protein, partial [Solirubrobacteraceae bacterium]